MEADEGRVPASASLRDFRQICDIFVHVSIKFQLMLRYAVEPSGSLLSNSNQPRQRIKIVKIIYADV